MALPKDAAEIKALFVKLACEGSFGEGAHAPSRVRFGAQALTRRACIH